MTTRLLVGDCREVMAGMEPNSFDACVTDPPYGLEFMGSGWDAPWDGDEHVGRRWGEGISEVKMADGAKRLPRPSFEKRNNVRCRACGKWRVFSNPCRCESPDFPNLSLANMVALQSWYESWLHEVHRVLKPGAYLLAFGGTRTFHRLTCAIEDAGFEVKDCLMWLYGGGFPKSHNISKLDGVCQCDGVQLPHDNDDMRRVWQGISGLAEDASSGEESDVLPSVQREVARSGVGDTWVQGAASLDGGGGSLTSQEDERPEQPLLAGRGDALPATRELQGGPARNVSAGVPADGSQGRVHHRASTGVGKDVRSLPTDARSRAPHRPRPAKQRPEQPASVPDAIRTQTCRGCGKPVVPKGLGTALKPAWEPIVVARKRPIGTVLDNYIQHGTGTLNIDACRIEGEGGRRREGEPSQDRRYANRGGTDFAATPGPRGGDPAGRWPANVVLDEVAADQLDRMTGELSSGRLVGKYKGGGTKGIYGEFGYADKNYEANGGGDSRFFYVAKASREERDFGLEGMPKRVAAVGNTDAGTGRNPNNHRNAMGHSAETIQARLERGLPPTIPRANDHPTVKPLALMRWLVRLACPPGGTVLDPFCGSGTTGLACRIEGRGYVLIDTSEHYIDIARRRIEYRDRWTEAVEMTKPEATNVDGLPLFAEIAKEGA